MDGSLEVEPPLRGGRIHGFTAARNSKATTETAVASAATGQTSKRKAQDLLTERLGQVARGEWSAPRKPARAERSPNPELITVQSTEPRAIGAGPKLQ
jgi:hypothetical protein